jgi:uncharacterized protein YeaO (DUF488 family)
MRACALGPCGALPAECGRRISGGDFFDVWLPELAPSDALFAWARSEPLTTSRFARFSRRYRAEMRKPAAQRLIALLAALATRQNISVGCYCADESRCHRSLLRELLQEAGAPIAKRPAGDARISASDS